LYSHEGNQKTFVCLYQKAIIKVGLLCVERKKFLSASFVGWQHVLAVGMLFHKKFEKILKAIAIYL
jgi:hypothetical protein